MDPAWLNKVLIRPIHRSLTLNYILSMLAVVKYLTFIDVSSGCHNLKLDEQSLMRTAFPCPFGRCRYIWLPFGITQAGDMFHRKIYKLFQGLPNLISLVDDILSKGFNNMSRNHDAAVNKVLRICKQANLKLNKDKCLFWCRSIPFLEEVILRSGVSLDPRKVQTLMAMPPPKCKNELQSFLSITNYLCKFSPMTDEVCKL